MRNEQLFRDVATQIENDPESYDQRVWGEETACGTQMCIAGHGARLSGLHPTWEQNGRERSVAWGRVALQPDLPLFALSTRPIKKVAEELFGLTRVEAYWLFDSEWIPKADMTVPEALEKLAAGTSIRDVTDPTIAVRFTDKYGPLND